MALNTGKFGFYALRFACTVRSSQVKGFKVEFPVGGKNNFLLH